MPETMRAVLCSNPRELSIVERPMPERKTGEALVRIRALGDVHQRNRTGVHRTRIGLRLPGKVEILEGLHVRGQAAGADADDEAAFEQVFARMNDDMTIRAAVLTGSGSAFCSGGNVAEMRDRTGMFGGTRLEEKKVVLIDTTET